jgi:hypothetical protein
MIDERDPTLQRLFAEAEEDLAGDVFTARVMEQARVRKVNAKRRAIAAALIALPCALVLAVVMQEPVLVLMQSLATSLVEVDNRLVAELLSPINNIGFVLAMAVLGLRFAYRKIFG